MCVKYGNHRNRFVKRKMVLFCRAGKELMNINATFVLFDLLETKMDGEYRISNKRRR